MAKTRQPLRPALHQLRFGREIRFLLRALIGLEAEHAFLDTAAVMAHLDLVITADTAVAHLAGALGRPVWIALRHVPEGRWMLDRENSPWYPTARLFRQRRAGDWDEVFARIAAELAGRAAGKGVA